MDRSNEKDFKQRIILMTAFTSQGLIHNPIVNQYRVTRYFDAKKNRIYNIFSLILITQECKTIQNQITIKLMKKTLRVDSNYIIIPDLRLARMKI